jgi:glutamate synthase (NADPH/NADH) small chain
VGRCCQIAQERRVSLLAAEGVRFVTGATVGRDVPGEKLRREFDAIALCGGATLARDRNAAAARPGPIVRALMCQD